MSIKLRFLGAARTVTGSSHLVSCARSEVLLDAGLFYGRRKEFYEVNTTFKYNARKINALVLSHAHIDHCGNIPTLVRAGLRCNIYATHATKELTRLMLEDSAKIQEEDVKYLNKINRRLGLPAAKALYTRKDVARVIKRIHPFAYHRKFQISNNVFNTFIDAGHILGSSTIALEIKDQDKTVRLGYCVDLGRKNLPMLNDPEIPKELDYLIIESTYGGRQHAPIEEAKVKLKDAINRTVERGGKVIIPAFSLERTQEVIYLLGQLFKDKEIPVIPVYVDSPLAMEITNAFGYYADYMDREIQQAIDAGETPLDFINLRFVHDQKESKRLNVDRRPMVIIAGSGMCESGRVLHHLKNNIEDSRNTVLVVGYMAKDTLGRKIVEKKPAVRIYGLDCQLNAEVVVINALSGHADKDDLVDFIKQCLPLKRIFLVHGDEEQIQILGDTLSNAGLNVHIPVKDEEVLLE